MTSRIAVADRARLPDGGLAVRLEPFDERQVARWLEIWNAAELRARAGPLPVGAAPLPATWPSSRCCC